MVVLSNLQTDLHLVETQMRKEIVFKTVKYEDLIHMPMNDLDKQLCPAIFLAVHSMKCQSDNKMISLASIFQYIFLANKIHRLVTDDSLADYSRQFPVLVGDFMFGQSFFKMCHDDLFVYAPEFVKLIETINEGVLYRWRLKKSISMKDYRIIFSKERASITALAAKLAAQVSDVQENHISKYEELGYCFGMAWASWEENICASFVQEYLAKAKNIINELKELHYALKPIQELYDFFYQQISPNVKLANIK